MELLERLIEIRNQKKKLLNKIKCNYVGGRVGAARDAAACKKFHLRAFATNRAGRLGHPGEEQP